MSRSEAIRQYLKVHPSASNSEVIEGLSREGVDVNANLVNQVRHDYKHKKVKDDTLLPEPDEDEPILRVQRLADELGGIDCLIHYAVLLKKVINNNEGVNYGSEEKSQFDGRAEARP